MNKAVSVLALGCIVAASGASADESLLKLNPGQVAEISRAKEFVRQNALSTGALRSLRDESLELKGAFELDGFKTVKFQQFYKGVPVHGQGVRVHTALNGLSNMESQTLALDLDVVPSVSETSAATIARGFTNGLSLGSIALEVLPNSEKTSGRLVYRVDFPSTPFEIGRKILVDAKTGEVVANLSKALHIADIEVKNGGNTGLAVALIPVRDSSGQVVIDPATGQPKIDGCMTKDFSTGKVQRISYLECAMTVQKTCQILDYQVGQTELAPLSLNYDVCPLALRNGQGSGPAVDDSARRADANSRAVLNYYQTQFGRNSYDGAGSASRSLVKSGMNFANAAWIEDLKIMIYGAGDGKEFGDFTQRVDVAGHEMTHGVVAATANLDSLDEAGAINEATADFFGKMIADDGNWLIGKGMFLKDPEMALRDLENPSRYKTQFLNSAGRPTLVPFPDHVSKKLKAFEECGDETNDRCYVHGNSTIMSHAYYLIHQAVGHEEAQKIIYTALTRRYQETTNFAEAGKFLRATCGELYSAGDCDKVDQALATVGI